MRHTAALARPTGGTAVWRILRTRPSLLASDGHGLLVAIVYSSHLGMCMCICAQGPFPIRSCCLAPRIFLRYSLRMARPTNRERCSVFRARSTSQVELLAQCPPVRIGGLAYARHQTSVSRHAGMDTHIQTPNSSSGKPRCSSSRTSVKPARANISLNSFVDLCGW